MSEKPRWNGGFEAARRIAANIMDQACLGDPWVKNGVDAALRRDIATALVEAFDDGVLAEHNATLDPKYGRETFIRLLREYGIGIATLDKIKARTIAIARGELKPASNE